METNVEAIDQVLNAPIVTNDGNSQTVEKNGRCYSCNGKKVGGFATLISAVVLLILSIIFASGVFGGGAMGIVGGGLALGSLVLFAISVILFGACVKSGRPDLGTPPFQKERIEEVK